MRPSRDSWPKTSAMPGLPAKLQAEKDLRALRGTDKNLDALIEECLNRLWLDAFGLGLLP